MFRTSRVFQTPQAQHQRTSVAIGGSSGLFRSPQAAPTSANRFMAATQAGGNIPILPAGFQGEGQASASEGHGEEHGDCAGAAVCKGDAPQPELVVTIERLVNPRFRYLWRRIVKNYVLVRSRERRYAAFLLWREDGRADAAWAVQRGVAWL